MSEEKKAAAEGAEKAPEVVEEPAAAQIDGVDPYAANGIPDEGLHGNADY